MNREHLDRAMAKKEKHRLELVDPETRRAFCATCNREVEARLVRRFGRWSTVCPEALFQNSGNKFHAKPYNTKDGKSFQSTLEGKRYEQLLLLEKAGEISNLRRQVPFRLHAPEPTEPSGKRLIGKYIADFVYEERGKQVVEETKGFWTQLASWKWKHVRSEYGAEYEFREVRKAKR